MNQYAYGKLEDTQHMKYLDQIPLRLFQTNQNEHEHILIACIAKLCLNKQTNKLDFAAQSGFSHLECGFLDANYHFATL